MIMNGAVRLSASINTENIMRGFEGKHIMGWGGTERKKKPKSLPDSNDRQGRVFVSNAAELFVFKWGK